ncbi:MAG: thermonuclease family protein [Planctomycetota bacterium]
MLRIVSYILVFLVSGAAGYGLAVWRSSVIASKGPRALDLRIIDGGVYRVRNVVDGDTIVLENGLHVRYHGANTPEKGRFVKDFAPMAAEATARNIELLKGKRARLRLANEPIDVHGRLVARVFAVPEDDQSLDTETDIRAVLIKEGLARSMAMDTTREEAHALKALEEEAKAAKVGLWGLEAKVRSDDGKLYCATSTSAIYHLVNCSIAQRIKAANRHTYASSAEAEAVGLKPCHKCITK